MWTTVASGRSLIDGIWIVVVVVVVATALILILWRFRRPPVWQSNRVSWRARRNRRIQEAAAANVAILRESGKKISPDAPGDHLDEL
jgi:cytochrome oxidase assembly protein ShyY1